jgi:hypothetical protein
MKWSNGNYRLFEPRDETGIAASCLFKKFILWDGFFFDCHTIRELGDVSTVSMHGNKTQELLEVAKQCTEHLLDVRAHFC